MSNTRHRQAAFRMKRPSIVFVNQPWLNCRPVPTSSLEIWTYEVARRLANDAEVTIVGGTGGKTLRTERFVDHGVNYVLLPTAPDKAIARARQKAFGPGEAASPYITSPWYYRLFSERLARLLAKL